MDFDLPFIVQRSIIKGIRPIVSFNFSKYRNAPIFDTMRDWDCWKWGNSTSLKKLAYAFCLKCPKSAGDIDGTQIFDAFRAGRFEEIYQYCMRDVETTHKIWQRMNFTYPAAERPRLKSAIALAV